MKSTDNNIKATEKLIRDYSKLDLEKLFKKYNTSLDGISVVSEEERIEEFGKNIIEIKENNTIWNRLKDAFINPFNIVLTIVAIITFIVVLWFVLGYNTVEKAVMFQGGWFVFGILSQTLIIHLIRTSKIPFVESKSSKQLLISTFAVVLITLGIAFTNIAIIFDLSPLPYIYLLWIVGLMAVYSLFIQIYKKIYIRNNKEWL